MAFRHLAPAALALLLGTNGSGRELEWPQWGGPTRDFHAVGEVAPEWPPGGPRVRWRRPVGEGYSSVAVVAGAAYTMDRDGENERVLAVSTADGRTLWSHVYPSPLPSWLRRNHGVGPRSTPLVSGPRVFAVGVSGTLWCLDRASGAVRWRRELVTGMGGTRNTRGYASSPLALGDLVVVPVGGQGRALVAFRQEDGQVAWSGGDFENALSSPFLIDVEGRREIVALLDGVVAGFDPANGRVRWHHAHGGQGERNVAAPLWGDDGLLFVSSAYGGGSRVLQLTRDGAGTRVRELWMSGQVRVMFTTGLRIGGYVYASSGDFGPVPLTAVEVGTGRIAWRDRSFARSNLVKLGERVLLLDEDGVLGVVTLAPQGLTVHSRHRLVDDLAWTPPSVVGERLYLRTARELLAVELP
ncbi:MAG TPA: PQQ-binding-like beta-propeller repeat protein [Vicinamibacteria bacterium]|nr:PQQ-binding-like beta-propeller repeat protein [Vicinamibacteria bacterium]